MKQHKFSRQTIPLNSARATAVQKLIQMGIHLAPSTNEVARKAYLHYLSQRSLRGYDLEHWLKAEARLLANHNHSRIRIAPRSSKDLAICKPIR